MCVCARATCPGFLLGVTGYGSSSCKPGTRAGSRRRTRDVRKDSQRLPGHTPHSARRPSGLSGARERTCPRKKAEQPYARLDATLPKQQPQLGCFCGAPGAQNRMEKNSARQVLDEPREVDIHERVVLLLSALCKSAHRSWKGHSMRALLGPAKAKGGLSIYKCSDCNWTWASENSGNLESDRWPLQLVHGAFSDHQCEQHRHGARHSEAPDFTRSIESMGSRMVISSRCSHCGWEATDGLPELRKKEWAHREECTGPRKEHSKRD